mgnify:CR=1 FL=1
MAAAKKIAVIEQGTDWSLDLVALDAAGVAIDITTGTLECQIRSGPQGTLWAAPTCTKTTPVSGQYRLSLTNAQTRNLPTWPSGRRQGAVLQTLWGDVEWTKGDGTKVRLHELEVRVNAEITI